MGIMTPAALRTWSFLMSSAEAFDALESGGDLRILDNCRLKESGLGAQSTREPKKPTKVHDPV
jgi:hypothetical protein